MADRAKCKARRQPAAEAEHTESAPWRQGVDLPQERVPRIVVEVGEGRVGGGLDFIYRESLRESRDGFAYRSGNRDIEEHDLLPRHGRIAMLVRRPDPHEVPGPELLALTVNPVDDTSLLDEEELEKIVIVGLEEEIDGEMMDPIHPEGGIVEAVGYRVVPLDAIHEEINIAHKSRQCRTRRIAVMAVF